MDRFESLRMFVRVAEKGSFSLAAKETSLSQATVSKQISELEQFLAVKLISRTTRRLSLTEAGQRFYKDAKSLLESFDHIVGEVRGLKERPAGTLRLATAIMFGRRQITPLLPRFQELYPDIVVEHYLSDAATDLVRDGIDVSLKVGDMKDSSYQARRVGATQRVAVASPAFLEKYGTPRHPSDLASMPCLVFLGQETPFEWRFRDRSGKIILVGISGNYRADTTEALREGALAGLGVFYAPLSTCGEEIASGQLVRLLTDYEPEPVPFYAVMPNATYLPQKTRVFIDFLRSQFRHSKWISTSGGPVGEEDGD